MVKMLAAMFFFAPTSQPFRYARSAYARLFVFMSSYAAEAAACQASMMAED